MSYVIGNWVSQWRQDIEIWENKIYMNRPTLAKGDGPLHRMRQSYKQFYPESPTPIRMQEPPLRNPHTEADAHPPLPAPLDQPAPPGI